MTLQVKSKKATRKKPISPTDLIPADYNPRKMSEESRLALKKSMEEFEDISGITWNKRTQNIITGHHRWKNLIEAHGINNLKFVHLENDKYAVHTLDDVDTTYIVRVVNWDPKKEKAANVAANSHTISGEFTADLQNILSEIEDSYNDLFINLKFDELKIDLNSPESYTSELSKDSWDSDIGKIDKTNANNTEMFNTFQIIFPTSEDKEAIKIALIKAMEGYNVQIR